MNKCLNCNKDTVHKKYCSQQCAKKYMQNKEADHICELCGKKYKKQGSLEKHKLTCKGKRCLQCNGVLHKGSKFCSKECEKLYIMGNEEYRKSMTQRANEKTRELGKEGKHWCQLNDQKAKEHIQKWYTVGIKLTREKAQANELWMQKDKEKLQRALKKIHTDENHKKVSLALKGKPKSEEHKKKLSQTMIDKGIAKGKNNPMYGKHPITTKGFKSGKRIDLNNQYFRSTWEANFARIIQYNNKQYEYEKHVFPVKIDGNDCTYLPDFKIDNIFYEIKGYWYDDAKIKTEAFMQQYPEIKLVIVDSEKYYKLRNKYKKLIDNWEGR